MEQTNQREAISQSADKNTESKVLTDTKYVEHKKPGNIDRAENNIKVYEKKQKDKMPST